MKNNWRYYDGEDCPVCGGQALVLTLPGNFVQDGALVKCKDCGARGTVVADDSCVYISWEVEEE